MGGTIRVIIRKEDGSILNMNRWTNSIPFFLNSSKFINKDKEHFDEYMSPYLAMKIDYEKNHESGDFEYAQTQYYFPEPTMVGPTGYGMVLIDYMTNTVLSCQSYTRLFRISHTYMKYLEFYKPNSETRLHNLGLDDDEIQDLLGLIESGLVNQVGYFDDDLEKYVVKPVEIGDHWGYLDKDEFCSFFIDAKPWELFNYDDEASGFVKLKAKVIELGFTNLDEEEWDNFCDADGDI